MQCCPGDLIMVAFEAIKEFYKISEETGRDTKYIQVIGIFDNRTDLDKWLEKTKPLNTYHVHYKYNTIREK